MMRGVTLLAVTASLVGCAPAASVETPTPPAHNPAPASCNAQALGSIAGRRYTPELGAELQRQAGARTLRVVRPGMAVTMDYRADRLTVSLGANDIIERAACG